MNSLGRFRRVNSEHVYRGIHIVEKVLVTDSCHPDFHENLDHRIAISVHIGLQQIQTERKGRRGEIIQTVLARNFVGTPGREFPAENSRNGTDFRGSLGN